MPAIDDMGGVLTVCAGRNMLFNLVLQSYSQIEKLYDKQAKEIKQNCQNHLISCRQILKQLKKFQNVLDIRQLSGNLRMKVIWMQITR